MKQPITRFPFHILATILFLCFSGVAQAPQDKPAKQDLALEVTRPGSRTIEIPVFERASALASSGADASTTGFNRIKEWMPSKEGEIVKSINFKNGREGDVVIARVSITMENEKVVEIGTYRLRENESAKTEDLTKFGVEAMVLKVIKAKPGREDPPPPAIQPKILNKTKALEVVSFYPTPGSSQSFQLSLKNISTKNILTLDLFMPSADGNGGGGQQASGADKDHPLILPDGIHVSNIWVSEGGRDTPAGYIPDPVIQRTLIIRTVVFDDGTYDGQVEPAAEMEAARRGKDIQRRRILRLLQEPRKTDDADLSESLNDLKEQTYALSQTADASVMVELAALYPSLDAQSKDRLSHILASGLSQGKIEFVRDINDFEETQKRPGEHITFSEWIRQTKAKYVKLTAAR